MKPGSWTVEFAPNSEQIGDAYVSADVRLAAGLVIPPHVDWRSDLHLHVLSGVVSLVLDGRARDLRPSDHAHVPRLVPRRVTALEESRLLILAFPAGLERLSHVINDATLSRDDRAAFLAVAGISVVPAAW